MLTSPSMRLFASINGRSFLSSAATMSAPKSNLAKLRKKTGYSLSLCKQALEKNENDVGKAYSWLEEQALTQGWAKANKLVGRNTSQGLVGVLLRGRVATMVELNCETDFVARNKQFHELLQEISSVTLANAKPTEKAFEVSHSTGEEMAQLKDDKGRNLADLLALNIGQIGENLSLRRGVSVTVGPELKLSAVTHPSGMFHASDNLQYGRFGSIIAYSKQKDWGVIPEGQTEGSMARQLAQHVIGMNPERVGDLSTVKVVESEETSNTSETDEKKLNEYGDIVDKDVAKLDQKRGEDSSDLVHQDFLLNPDETVGQILLETGLDVKGFVRFEVGQELDD